MASSEADKLDFTSEHFDAVLALTSENVQPPDAEAKPLDNLSQYTNLVAKKSPGQKRQPDVVSIEQSMAVLSAQRKERLEAMMLKARTADSDEDERVQKGGTRRKTTVRNVLTFMDAVHQKQGPLGALYKCLKDRIRVKVWTRNYSQVRGICTGYVVAFDKHWNLAMTDVDETYVLRSGVKRVATGKKVVKVTDSRIIEEEDEEDDENQGQASSKQPEDNKEEETEEDLQLKLTLLKEQLQQISQEVEEEEPSTHLVDSSQQTVQQKRTKENRKNTHRRKKVPPVVKHRHVNQLFVRGDNVVIIALLEC